MSIVYCNTRLFYKFPKCPVYYTQILLQQKALYHLPPIFKEKTDPSKNETRLGEAKSPGQVTLGAKGKGYILLYGVNNSA